MAGVIEQVTTADNSKAKTVGEKAAALLPAASVAAYTGVNVVISNPPAFIASSAVSTAKTVWWLIMIVVTTGLVISNNQRAEASKKIGKLQIFLTVLTFAAWSATLGNVLTFIVGWSEYWGPLSIGALSALLPLYQAMRDR